MVRNLKIRFAFTLSLLLATLILSTTSIQAAQPADKEYSEKVGLLFDIASENAIVSVVVEADPQSGHTAFAYTKHDKKFEQIEAGMKPKLENNEVVLRLKMNYEGLYASNYFQGHDNEMMIWSIKEGELDPNWYFKRGNPMMDQQIKAVYLVSQNGNPEILETNIEILDIRSDFNDSDFAFIEVEKLEDNALYPAALVNSDNECVGLIIKNGFAFCGWYQPESTIEVIQEANTDISESVAVTTDSLDKTDTNNATALTDEGNQTEKLNETEKEPSWMVEVPVYLLIGGGLFFILLIVLVFIILRLFKEDRRSDLNTKEIEEAEETETLPQDEVTETLPQDEVTETLPQDEVTETLPQDEVTETLPQDEVTETLPQDEETQTLPTTVRKY